LKKTKQNNLKKYECLLILDAAGKEETEKEILDRVQKEIQQAGGKIETVQKMGPKPLARTVRGRSAGNYVNVIFLSPPAAIRELDAKFHLDTDLFRWQVTDMPPEPKERKVRTKKPEAAVAKV
jgi:ribosomal protein S6